jgi:hypothetical protein
MGRDGACDGVYTHYAVEYALQKEASRGRVECTQRDVNHMFLFVCCIVVWGFGLLLANLNGRPSFTQCGQRRAKGAKVENAK